MPRPENVLQLIREPFEFPGWEQTIARRLYFRIPLYRHAASQGRVYDKSKVKDVADKVSKYVLEKTRWPEQTGIDPKDWENFSGNQVLNAFNGAPQMFAPAAMSVLALEKYLSEIGSDYDIYKIIEIVPCTYYVKEVKAGALRAYCRVSGKKGNLLEALGQTANELIDLIDDGYCVSPRTAGRLHEHLRSNGFTPVISSVGPYYTHPCKEFIRKHAAKIEKF